MAKKKKKSAEPEIDATKLGDIMAGLDSKSLAILMEIRRNPGKSMVKIADGLGIHRTTVASKIKDPKFKRALAEITSKASKLLDRYAPDAARLLGRQISDDADPNLAQRAALGILKHTEGTKINLGMDDDELPEGIDEEDAGLLIEGFLKGLKGTPKKKKE